MATKPKPPPLGNSQTVLDLRFAARIAYLDGRTGRAKALNKRADDLARTLRLAETEG